MRTVRIPLPVAAPLMLLSYSVTAYEGWHEERLLILPTMFVFDDRIGGVL